MPSVVDPQPPGTGPLSPAQELMWLLAQLDPESPAYIIPVCAWIGGALDTQKLRSAWQSVAHHHDALRTRFPLVDGIAVSLVEREHQPEFTLVEAIGETDEERERAALVLASSSARRAFDLVVQPPWRILLVRVAGDRHLLAITFHHIIVDGASLPWLFADFSRAYIQRPDDQVPETTITPYSTFTAWQNAFLGSERCAGQLAYWQRTLAELEPLNLPIDRPRPRKPTSNGARFEVPLPDALATALEARAKDLGVSSFSFLFASFAALIQRCTGATDVPIATQVDNRATAGSDAPPFRRLVGMCSNTVIIRTGCTGDQPFGDFARAVDGLVGEALRNADVPFERVVGTQHDGGRQANQAQVNLLFDVEIPSMVPRLEIPGLSAEFITIDNRTAMFDLVVSLHLVAKPSCSIRYSTDLFDEGSVRRLLAHYLELLGGIAAEQLTRIRDLPLLDRQERETVTVEWNRTAHEVPTEICIHQLFEAQVRRTPDGIALVHERGELGYRMLNLLANQLSRQLRARGAGPEVLVGILLDRSLELIVAVLAVLKSGAAYVPCDRKMTRSRIAYLVKDAALRLVITQPNLRALLPDGVEQLIMPLPVSPAQEQPDDPVSGVQEGNVAYVIYTSGSTGEPKGVVVEHRSAVNAIIATIARYADLSCDRTLFQSSITFDSSVTKIFQSLCNGGTLYIAPEGADFDQALELTVRYRIPRLTTTPSELALLNATPERLPGHIEIIGAAGENLTISDVDRIIERIPILNIYGPTETTISTTCFCLTKAYHLAGGTVPIGKPIMNYRVYVLDRFMNPMPIGCIGELYIAGSGLARGYLNAPELTAERFVLDPFTPGGRLYRSGDLARWLPDGNLEFKGRVDQQVKIRGFRIELGEIEHALGRHADVRQAVVVARQAKSVGTYLTAYVVMSSPQAPAEALRGFLAETLPDYMVPARFVRLDEFPRMVSGKIDRKALPEPDWSTGGAQEQLGRRSPYIPLHTQLLRIWESLLGIKDIAITDNFFALGGHSLLAARMLAEAGRQLGRPVPMTLLFEGPTIEQLAAAMLHEFSPQHRPLIELTPGNGDPPFFFLHGDLVGGGYYTVELARLLGAQVPFQVLAPLPVVHGQAPPTVAEMASEHIRLIRTVSPHGPYRLGGYCNGGVVMFEAACQLIQTGERVEFLGLIDAAIGARHLGVISRAIELVGAPLGLSIDQQLRCFAYLDNRLGRLTDPDELGNAVRAMWKRWWAPLHDRLPAEVDEQEGGHLLRSSLWATARYRPQHFPGNLTLYMANGNRRHREHTEGWTGYADHIEVHSLPGHHFDIITHQVEYLAAALVKDMTRSPQAAPVR